MRAAGLQRCYNIASVNGGCWSFNFSIEWCDCAVPICHLDAMSNILDSHTGAVLLRLARRAIESHLRGTTLNNGHRADLNAAFHGVFVTLRKQSRLRGCIGTFNPGEDINDTILQIAIAAARDPRFAHTPLCLSELPHIRLELSILSALERLDDPLAFERGVHGIRLRVDGRTGCFLPEVGIEQGWTREQFLSELCRHKLGLPADAWKDPAVEAYAFTVLKFVE